MRALGLMSGTSLDGVDVAMLESDGESAIGFGPHASFPLDAADRTLLRQALSEAVAARDRRARPGLLAAADALVTLRHAEAVEAFCARYNIARDSIDVVGFHGQTVLHRPSERLTIQIGDGQVLADRLKTSVVWDFRAADVAAGGQGAPLVPVYHRALVASAGLEGATVLVNIGGVANLTLIRAGTDPLACDTGPGNALLDDLILERTGEACDRDGAISGAGTVNEAALATLLDHPFFAAPPPKSLDRNAFSRHPVADLATEDAAATLAAFTAAAIAQAVAKLPGQPRRVIVCGGGGYNPTILRELRRRLPDEVVLSDKFGWSIDAMEAQAFAYLAVRSLKGLPLSFPSTTGVPAPMLGGVLSRPGS